MRFVVIYYLGTKNVTILMLIYSLKLKWPEKHKRYSYTVLFNKIQLDYQKWRLTQCCAETGNIISNNLYSFPKKTCIQTH